MSIAVATEAKIQPSGVFSPVAGRQDQHNSPSSPENRNVIARRRNRRLRLKRSRSFIEPVDVGTASESLLQSALADQPGVLENKLGLPRAEGNWIRRRIRLIRGEAAMLASDLAAALGVTEARLHDLVRRYRDWFGPGASVSLSVEECRRYDVWWLRSNSWNDENDGLPIAEGLRPSGTVAFTLDGVIACCHWLATESSWATDPMPVPDDLHDRFQAVWQAMSLHAV